ncbi:MAG: BREX-1 system adenine-specific DNA-methyltransferase PglX [Acidobacteria bacterium]|nr:BREX-1 system adenine-specific DNA-methyltransferase PglX [Acidobacteriota bacterium]MCI0724955.1 BREX-1 system adenine-specific DNA-methyltransferase PglX [Acidobacteriota bacterium]
MNGEPQALLDEFKDAVKGWVPKVRDVLDKDFTAELKRLGIPPTGKPTPIDRMNLPEEDRQVRARAEALLRRDSISEGSEQKGYENVRRELSYTCLNRLVGLKCMEARELLYLPPPGAVGASPEPTEVITNIPGQARSRYLRDLRAAGGSRYKYSDNAEETLLRDGLTAAYRFITSEIRILFDPDHEYACVWPTHGCLMKVIGMINDDLPDGVYRAQDFLGWVYQFFNRDEKKKVRDENKGTPRSSYELSVINQFYTPSWVVKALVDNTLGRLWLQMHPDSSVRPKVPPPSPSDGNWYQPVADYLVPNTGEKIRYERLTEDGQVETFKRAADIALLDPACGTMHFGQYAFGLFHQMYLDEIRHVGEPGWPTEPSIRDSKLIPATIIEKNLHGIDIEARAIQIASLSLLLTAKEAAVRNGDSPLDVRLRKSNLVVANAVNIGEDQLRSLVGRLGDRLGSPSLQEALFKTMWENLQNVGELGSLIQVRESVTRVLDEWVNRQAKDKGITRIRARRDTGQLVLETIVSELERDQRKQMELERRVLEDEAEQIRQELLAGLEDAARSDADPAQRLFAEDTVRGLKLLELLSRHYDVVVMNPPYGAFVPKVKEFINTAYKLTKNNIYSVFIERAAQLVHAEGYVGALVSSTFVNLKDFEKLRTEILLKRNPMILMLDLGFGILDDATVEAAAIVLKGGTR